MQALPQWLLRKEWVRFPVRRLWCLSIEWVELSRLRGGANPSEPLLVVAAWDWDFSKELEQHQVEGEEEEDLSRLSWPIWMVTCDAGIDAHCCRIAFPCGLMSWPWIGRRGFGDDPEAGH